MTPPQPHKPKNPRAFVLGCDPTAFKDKKKTELRVLIKVFGIDEDGRYFAGILANLKHLGLTKADVYVQNLVTEFLEKETSKNKKVWKEKAIESIPKRKQEFDRVDPSGKLPVFLTSWLLYEVLLNDDLPRKTPAALYADIEIIPASKNKLGRPLVPFFRHYKYGYKEKPDYFKTVAALFKS